MTHHHDLSAQELKSYQASGYLIRKDVFSLSEITQLRPRQNVQLTMRLKCVSLEKLTS